MKYDTFHFSGNAKHAEPIIPFLVRESTAKRSEQGLFRLIPKDSPLRRSGAGSKSDGRRKRLHRPLPDRRSLVQGSQRSIEKERIRI